MNLKTITTLLLIVGSYGDAIAQSADTINISQQFRQEAIGPYCFVRTGTAFQAYAPANGDWIKSKSVGYWLSPNNKHWVYAALKNTDTVDRSLKLYINNVQAGIIKMYLVIDGNIDSSKVSGSLVPFANRASSDRLHSISFLIPSGKTAALYLACYRKEIGITINLNLQDASLSAAFVWADYLLLIVLAFIFLIVIAAIVALIYLPSKETVYFFFYVFFGFLYVLAASGFGSLYIWSGFPRFEENAAVFLGATSTAAFLEFSRRVLKVWQTSKFLNRLIQVFSVTYVLLGITGYFFYAVNFEVANYSQLLQFPYFLMSLLFVVILGLSIQKAAYKKQKEFWWFVSIFSFYILMSLVTILLETGIIIYNYKMHPALLAFGALPQMVLTLCFSIVTTLQLLRNRESEILSTRLKGEQAILRERLRISAELHDEVGATLSGISMYSHLTKQQIKNADTTEVEKSLNIMQQSAGEMVNKLNDIVWLVNPDQDSLQKLIQRLEEYATDMAAVKNMEVKLNVAEILLKHSLPIDTRRNIYLFYKEAINNAVKYSNAVLLELDIKAIDNNLEFSVSDNGKGFDAVNVRRGNGLGNMQKRANEIGANLTLYSKPGEGTFVSMQINIPDEIFKISFDFKSLM